MKTETCIRIRPTKTIFKGFPSLVPFISIFFILIFFTVLASNCVPVSGYRVELPRANADVKYITKVLVVTVDKNGKLYFNDTPVENMDKLKERISKCKVRYKETTDLLVRSDAAVNIDVAMQILEIARDLKLSPYFVVERPSAKKANFQDIEK